MIIKNQVHQDNQVNQGADNGVHSLRPGGVMSAIGQLASARKRSFRLHINKVPTIYKGPP